MTEPSHRMPAKWRDLFAAEQDAAAEMLRRDGTLPALFVIHGAERVAVPGGWADDDERERCIDTLRLLAMAYQAEAVSMSCEAWLSHPAPDEPPIQPQHSERRREVLLVTFGWRAAGERHVRLSAREIERAADGGIAGLGADLSGGHDAGEGSILHRILPPFPVPDVLARVMREALAAAGISGEAFAQPTGDQDA